MNAIKEHRVSAGIRQNELAEKLKVRQSTVSMWETGSARPRIGKLLILANLFGCSIEELLDKEEESA